MDHFGTAFTPRSMWTGSVGQLTTRQLVNGAHAFRPGGWLLTRDPPATRASVPPQCPEIEQDPDSPREARFAGLGLCGPDLRPELRSQQEAQQSVDLARLTVTICGALFEHSQVRQEASYL
jgi:hypothetical protein